jgi:hypothetical protein
MEDKYKVRVSFNHGNAINLELNGCGQLYILPGKDYFFENAPMKFLNYLTQLKRLGITYKITSDKKGCYSTMDLSNYLNADPRYIMGNVRDGIMNEALKNRTIKPIKEDKVPEGVEVPDLIPEVSDVTIFPAPPVVNIPEHLVGTPVEVPPVAPEETGAPKVEEGSNEEDKTSEVMDPNSATSGEGTEKQEGTPTGEEVTSEPTKVEVPEDLSVLSKPSLLELANKLGLTEVTDLWSKKEIKEAIANSQAPTE